MDLLIKKEAYILSHSWYDYDPIRMIVKYIKGKLRSLFSIYFRDILFAAPSFVLLCLYPK